MIQTVNCWIINVRDLPQPTCEICNYRGNSSQLNSFNNAPEGASLVNMLFSGSNSINIPVPIGARYFLYIACNWCLKGRKIAF